MKRKTAPEYVLLTALCLGTGSVLYRSYESHPTLVYAATPRPVASQGTNYSATALITPQDRRVIHEYVITHSNTKGKSLAPGLARRAERSKLSNGWEMKLVRGELMSPEVYRECHPLPPDVTRLLAPQPAGTVLVSIDGKVVRLARINLEILDVFDAQS